MCSSNWFPPTSTPDRIYVRTFPTRRNEKDGYYLNFLPCHSTISRFIWFFFFLHFTSRFHGLCEFCLWIYGLLPSLICFPCCCCCCLVHMLLSCLVWIFPLVCTCLGLSFFLHLCGNVLCAPWICFFHVYKGTLKILVA